MTSSYSAMYMVPKTLYESFLSKSSEGNMRYVRQINNLDVTDGGKVTIRNDNTIRKSTSPAHHDAPRTQPPPPSAPSPPSPHPLPPPPPGSQVMSGLAKEVPSPRPEQEEEENEEAVDERFSSVQAANVGVNPVEKKKDAGVQATPTVQDAQVQSMSPVHHNLAVQANPVGKDASVQTFSPTALQADQGQTKNPSLSSQTTKKNQKATSTWLMRHDNNQAEEPLRHFTYDDDDDIIMTEPDKGDRLKWLKDDEGEDLFLGKQRVGKRDALALDFQPNVSVSVPGSNVENMIDLINRKGTSNDPLVVVGEKPKTRRKKAIRANVKKNNETEGGQQQQQQRWITLGKRKSDRIKLNKKIEPPVKYMLYE